MKEKRYVVFNTGDEQPSQALELPSHLKGISETQEFVAEKARIDISTTSFFSPVYATDEKNAILNAELEGFLDKVGSHVQLDL